MGSRENYLFLIDVSQSMQDARTFGTCEVSKLDRALAYVETKLAQFVQRGLKTLRFAVTLIGAPKTSNLLTDAGKEGYDGIREWINFNTADTSMSQNLDRIKTSKTIKTSKVQCDLLSALIAGVAMLEADTGGKKQAKQLVLLTDGESATAWEEDDVARLVTKMNDYGVELTVIGVDFDDAALGFKEENKSEVKAYNEQQLALLVDRLDNSLIGNLERALKVATGPQIKATNSREAAMTLHIGDVAANPDESLSIDVAFKKASSRQAVDRAQKLSIINMRHGKGPKNIVNPSGRSKIRVDNSDYGLASRRRPDQLEKAFMEFQETAANEDEDSMDVDEVDDQAYHTHEVARSFMRYYAPKEDPSKTSSEVNRSMERAAINQRKKDANMPLSESQQPQSQSQEEVPLELVDVDRPLEKAYLYGGTRVPVGDMDELKFELQIESGMEVLACMAASQVRREWILNDAGYVYASTKSPKAQVKFSALVMALIEKDFVMIVRYIASVKSKPLKIGLLLPRISEDGAFQYCIFVQMPFAEDLRRFSFPTLTLLRNRKGKEITEHSMLPTDKQNEAMSSFVDAMDLDSAAVDDDGEPCPWFNIEASYNPAIHNVKMAIFHRYAHPHDTRIPQPHPETTKYMVPPLSVIEKASQPLKQLKDAMNVKAVPIKVSTGRGKKKDNRGLDGDTGDIDLDEFLGDGEATAFPPATAPPPPKASSKRVRNDSETESEEEPDQPPAKTLKTDQFIDPDEGDPIQKFSSMVERPSQMITEAVASLLFVAKTYIKQMGGRKWDDAVKCLEFLRPQAAELDEPDAYNDFMRELKQECEASDGGALTKFWNERILKAEVGLITEAESAERPDVSPDQAKEFFQPV